MPGQPPVVSKCSFHFTACPPCKRTRFVPWVRPQRLSFPRLATRDAATRSLLTELLTLGFLLPPSPGRIQYQVIYLPYGSHISPPSSSPRPPPLHQPPLCPPCPFRVHAQDETTTLTAPPLRPFTGSQAGSTRPSGLCPAPNHIT